MRALPLLLAVMLLSPSLRAQDHGGAANATRSGLVVIPRLGVLLAGGGETQAECSGSLCTPGFEAEFDYDDESRFALGADVLGNIAENFRLGGGLWFVPDTEFEDDAGTDLEWGSDLSLVFIGEGLIDLSADVAFAGRLFAGGLVHFPGGDAEDAINAAETACDPVEALGGECEVSDGPYLGFTLGAGLGVVGSLGRVALRGDLIAQWYTLPFVGVDASAVGTSLETTTNSSGTRFWLSAGLEF